MKTFNTLKVSFLALLIVLLLSSEKGFTQTIKTGTINTETWTLAGSPYIITGNINVSSNNILTIQEGVDIIVKGSYQITVTGCLLANGTAAQPINFMPFSKTTGWKGLLFTDTNNPTTTSVMNYCTVSYSIGNDNGGGISVAGSTRKLNITNCTISNNQALLLGGGVYLNNASNTTISNSIIAYNLSTGYTGAGAGGIHIASGSPTIINNYITNNNAINNDGGGILVNGGTPKIINNVICNNKAGDWGGGVCFHSSAGAGTVFVNNVISNNTADEGGCIYFNSAIKIYNSIISGGYATYGKNVALNSAVKPTFDYCFVEGGTAAFSGTWSGTFTNTISTGTVGFVNPTDDSGTNYCGYLADWSLLPTSQCINKGLNSYVSAYTTDLVANTRAIGTVDLGAFEYQLTPAITTDSINTITTTSAKLFGNVLSNKGYAITERGFYYSSTNPIPSTSDNKVIALTGTGAYNTTISGLTANILYYVRAYAKNSQGIAFGAVKTFQTLPSLAVVSTFNPFFVSLNTIEVGGNVSSQGTSTVSERGIVWGTSLNPTISNSSIVVGSGLGMFNTSLSSLTANTTYYVRAYAKNASGYSYGENQTFKTSNKVIFVKQNGNDTKDGSTWANAYATLTKALSVAAVNNEIWVATGTYIPTTTTNRSASFSMVNDVAIYGGFAGTETGLSQRNWNTNPTILSGAISGGNSYHVIYNNTNSLNSTAVLDGFIICNGKANGTGVTDSIGGGMYNNNVSPTIQNCIFRNNSANSGGAIYNTSSSPFIQNCLFDTNSATYFVGGAICNYSGASNPVLQNCTFVNNTATISGSAIANLFAFTTLNNSILWENGTEIYDDGNGGVSANYNIIQGGYGGTGNFWQDPEFTTSTDFTLKQTSPAINSGNLNTTNSISKDLAFNSRVYNGASSLDAIDLGAYEYQGEPLNRRPELQPVANQNLLINDYTDITFQFHDVDFNDVSLALAANGNMTMQSISSKATLTQINRKEFTQTYRFTPTKSWAGIATITATVTDSKGATDVQIFTINVSNEFCGHITKNTTWDEVSTIKVTCDVVIDPNVTLTIAAGRTVEFQGYYRLDVKGRLVASGTEVDSIIFKASNSSTGWAGIRFENVQPPKSPQDTSKLEYCRIQNGKANGTGTYANGGAIYIDNFNRVFINQCTFYKNTATAKGGAIYINSSHPILTSCFIRDNQAQDGGGIYFDNSTNLSMYNSLISNNKALRYGGGFYAFNNSNPLCYNNTIAYNTAVANGGGVYIDGYNNSIFKNTIFWGNTALTTTSSQISISGYNATSTTPSFSYCDINQSQVATTSASITYGSGMINADPLFVSAVVDRDYNLKSNSPCVNVGDPAIDITLYPVDLAGNVRSVGTKVDMGSYEYMVTVVWTGASTSNHYDWYNANNWSPAQIPIPSNNVRIPAVPSGGANYFPTKNSNPNTGLYKGAEVNNLTIDAGAKLTIPPSQWLITRHLLTLNGFLTIQSDISATASYWDKGSITYGATSSVTFERTMQRQRFHYFSSPFESVNASIFNDYGKVYPNYNFYYYDQSLPASEDWLKGWVAIKDNRKLAVGTGYAFYYPYNDRIYVMNGGKINTGNFSTNVVNSNKGFRSDGWNLIGNPYACAINVGKFIDANTNILSGGVYFWDDDASNGKSYTSYDYAVMNKIGSISASKARKDSINTIYKESSKLPNGIAATQAFFVKAITSGTVSFTNAMKQVYDTDNYTNGSTAPATVRYFKSTNTNANLNPNVIERFKVGIVNPQEYYNEVLIAFKSDASEGMDNWYDSPKLQGNSSLSLYSLLDNTELSIQTLPYLQNDRTILLGLNAGIAGIYTFESSLLENFPAGTAIYLHDKKDNKTVNIIDGNYVFSTEKGIFNDRFEIVFQTPYTWTGIVSNDWNTAANWNKNQVPTANNSVYIPFGSPEIANNVECYHLTIGETATLLVKANAKLTVNGNVLIESGEKGTGQFIDLGTFVAKNKTNVEKFIVKNSECLLTSPVNQAKGSAFAGLVKKSKLQNNFLTISDNLPVKNMFAYTVAMDDRKDNKLIFEGILNSGIYNVVLNDEGTALNLIGNPYPSSLDWSAETAWSKDNIEKTLYRFNGTNYTYYNANLNLNVNGGSALIEPMEGFFVKAIQKGTLKVDNTARTFTKNYTKSVATNYLKIKVQGKYNSDETLIACLENASQTYEGDFDAIKLFTENTTVPQLFTKTLAGEKLAINTISPLKTNTDIPLGFESSLEGNFTISINEMNLDTAVIVLLEDTYKVLTVNLKSQDYVFSSDENIENRFILHFIVASESNWTGTVSNDWNEPKNWDNGVPIYNTTAIIQKTDNQLIVLKNVACRNMIIMPNASVFVPQGDTIKLSGTLTLKSDETGNASLLELGKVIANQSIVEKYLFNNQNFISTPILQTDASVIGNSERKEFVESQNEFVSTTQTIEVAKGYAIANQSGTRTCLFNGTLNTDNQTISVNNTNKGWNLIGNPYPSVIDWERVSCENLDKALYRWNPALQNYQTYVSGVGATSRYISSTESFFVKANSSFSMTFNNSMRVSETKENTKVENVLRFKVTAKNGSYDETFIRFIESAMESFDNQYDAYKLFSTVTTVPQIYTTTNNELYSINSLPLNNALNSKVAISFKGSTGKYTLSLSENSFASEFLYLEDTKTGTIVDLKQTNSYSFESDGADYERFVVYFAKTGRETGINTETQTDAVNVYSNKKTISIIPEINGADTISVEICTVNGSLIYKGSATNQCLTTLNLNVVSGTYFVKVKGKGKTWTKKVVLIF